MSRDSAAPQPNVSPLALADQPERREAGAITPGEGSVCELVRPNEWRTLTREVGTCGFTLGEIAPVLACKP